MSKMPIYCTCSSTWCSPTKVVNSVGAETIYTNPVTKQEVVLVVSVEYCMTCGYPTEVRRTNVNRNREK